MFDQAGYVSTPVSEAVLGWLERVIDAVLKNLDYLSQLPQPTKVIFEYDARTLTENAEIWGLFFQTQGLFFQKKIYKIWLHTG